MTRSEILDVLALHAAWLRGEAAGARARADLSGANLRSADLSSADLSGANLSSADLSGADLSGANLRSADLSGANLRSADLSSADLRSANLSGADLSGANLRSANLSGADLSGANLRSADLSSADLSSANLSGTCLDPAATLPTISDEEITAAGLELDGSWVIGWRTARSVHVGSTEYLPGSVHAAPWFSADTSTSCHPGIYLASVAWLDDEFGLCARVRCRCLRAELCHAGEKWRAKRLWIQCADGSWPEVTP